MTKPVIIEGLSYAYPPLIEGRTPEWVLRGVDLKIERGEMVSIMGPTGVGKTTLCLALLGIVPQSTGGIIKGDVFIEGHNTKHHPIAELAQQVGLVFQDPESQLFNRSAESEVAFGLENLGLPREQIGERIAWALGVMGIQHLRHRHPAQMSGGEKQRLAIASVLAMQPRILVLDEPTSNLDPLGKGEVFAAVDRLRGMHGMTIILVEQESEYVAEYSDRVVVLKEGVVDWAAGPREVFSDVARMRRLGLSVPQVSEVAAALNATQGTDYCFTRLQQASQALARELDG